MSNRLLKRGKVQFVVIGIEVWIFLLSLMSPVNFCSFDNTKFFESRTQAQL
jgi:hypothetical protein